jgi:hypothetical protein
MRVAQGVDLREGEGLLRSRFWQLPAQSSMPERDKTIRRVFEASNGEHRCGPDR